MGTEWNIFAWSQVVMQKGKFIRKQRAQNEDNHENKW